MQTSMFLSLNSGFRQSGDTSSFIIHDCMPVKHGVLGLNGPLGNWMTGIDDLLIGRIPYSSAIAEARKCSRLPVLTTPSAPPEIPPDMPGRSWETPRTKVHPVGGWGQVLLRDIHDDGGYQLCARWPFSGNCSCCPVPSRDNTFAAPVSPLQLSPITSLARIWLHLDLSTPHSGLSPTLHDSIWVHPSLSPAANRPIPPSGSCDGVWLPRSTL